MENEELKIEGRFVEYGTKVSSITEMREKCSAIDCLGRMIMGEAMGESRTGQLGCAYVVKNRQNSGKSEFGADAGDYKSIVLYQDGGQFNGVDSPAAFNPKGVDASAWANCIDVASNFIFESNPIGSCLWFNTNKLFNQVLKENGGKYKFGGGVPKKVTEKVILGGHTFFKVEGY